MIKIFFLVEGYRSNKLIKKVDIIKNNKFNFIFLGEFNLFFDEVKQLIFYEDQQKFYNNKVKICKKLKNLFLINLFEKRDCVSKKIIIFYNINYKINNISFNEDDKISLNEDANNLNINNLENSLIFLDNKYNLKIKKYFIFNNKYTFLLSIFNNNITSTNSIKLLNNNNRQFIQCLRTTSSRIGVSNWGAKRSSLYSFRKKRFLIK